MAECPRPLRRRSWALVFALLGMGGCAFGQDAGRPPSFAHVLVVIEENHSYEDIIGRDEAPYINEIASSGALFTHAFAVEHPSQPNYLDIFSGGNQGITDDSCPHTLSGPNLGTALLEAGKSFVGYSEDMPYAGCTGCASATYRRKHNPWVDFTNLPDTSNLPLSAFPSSYSSLPIVCFVIPGLETDMHDGTIEAADSWLRARIDGYLVWARHHNSLLILTWDESEGRAGNHIPLIFAGAHVRAGRYGERVNHFSVLRTIEAMYGLAPIGASAAVKPIVDIWK